MKNHIKKIFFVMLLTFSLTTTSAVALKVTKSSDSNEEVITSNPEKKKIIQLSEGEDLDPLVDLQVTVTIKEIRAFDKIDLLNDPDFYVKLIINEEEFTSDIWHNQKYVKEEWKKTVNVPDDVEFVSIKIQLWDSDLIFDSLCDIASNNNDNTNRHDITVYYSLKTGHWTGDDSISTPHSWEVDYSGYGHANGCDDNSIYQKDRDCELWFDISQNDKDGDGIPYWAEMNIFNETGECAPEVDDSARDPDEDGVSVGWEYKWGHYFDRRNNHRWLYHPFEWDDHENMDPDADSINNFEEYLTSNWGSDPFRKDIFVELDQMQGTDEVSASLLPEGSKDLMKDAFNRQNIILHIDDGSWGEGSGSDMLPFDNTGDNTTREELREIYNEYFLHGDENNWRRGVFHYGLVVYNSTFSGFAFQSNAFQISRKYHEEKSKTPFMGDRDVVYASGYMHELGHSLGLMWLLGHETPDGYSPLHLLWWKCRAYKSVMNYGYMFGFIWDLVDFSDGSCGKNDFDDWSNIDYSYFES